MTRQEENKKIGQSERLQMFVVKSVLRTPCGAPMRNGAKHVNSRRRKLLLPSYLSSAGSCDCYLDPEKKEKGDVKECTASEKKKGTRRDKSCLSFRRIDRQSPAGQTNDRHHANIDPPRGVASPFLIFLFHQNRNKDTKQNVTHFRIDQV